MPSLRAGRGMCGEEDWLAGWLRSASRPGFVTSCPARHRAGLMPYITSSQHAPYPETWQGIINLPLNDRSQQPRILDTMEVTNGSSLSHDVDRSLRVLTEVVL